MKKIFLVLILLSILISGCQSAADTASYNISKAADQFEVTRRIVFYNGITDKYILVVEGLCSLGNYDSEKELSVTCKVGPNSYKKHFLGLSDNVTYVAEQIDAVDADLFHYRIMFRPETLIPNINLDTSSSGRKK